MQMLVPGGGSWFDWVERTAPSSAPGGHAGTEEPTVADVSQALEAMRAGHLEYVILDAGDGTFVQAAGSGDAGYQLERWVDGEVASSSAGARMEDVRASFAAYLEGERPARAPGGPAADPASRKSGRRWFGRG